jgi:hypothetical protein
MFHSLAMAAALAIEAVTSIATYIVDALTPFFAFSEIEEDTILPNRSAQIVETARTGNEIVKNDTETKPVETTDGMDLLDRVQLHITADGLITAILPIGTTKIIAIAKTDTVEVLAVTKNEYITLLDIIEPIDIDFAHAYTKALARVPKALDTLRDSQRRRALACTTSATKAGTAICPRKVKVQRIIDDINGVPTKRTRTRKSKSQRKSKSKSNRSAVRGATDQEHGTTCSTRPTHGRRCV